MVLDARAISKILAASSPGKWQTLNYRKMATDVGVVSTAIKNYFTILEEKIRWLVFYFRPIMDLLILNACQADQGKRLPW